MYRLLPEAILGNSLTVVKSCIAKGFSRELTIPIPFTLGLMNGDREYRSIKFSSKAVDMVSYVPIIYFAIRNCYDKIVLFSDSQRKEVETSYEVLNLLLSYNININCVITDTFMCNYGENKSTHIFSGCPMTFACHLLNNAPMIRIESFDRNRISALQKICDILHEHTEHAKINIPHIKSTPIVKHYMTLLFTEPYDVTFISDDAPTVPIYAHKSTLRENSEYFETLFNGDWKDSGGKITSSHDSNVIMELLKYIYFGEFDTGDNNSQFITKLLCCSHEYAIPGLQVLCEDQLMKCLSHENIADSLLVSQRLNTSNLKRHCLNYMSEHATQLLSIKSVRDFMHENPEIMDEYSAHVALEEAASRDSMLGKRSSEDIAEELRHIHNCVARVRNDDNVADDDDDDDDDNDGDGDESGEAYFMF